MVLISTDCTFWFDLKVASPFHLFAYLGQRQDKAEDWATKEFRYKLAIAVRRDLDMGKGKIAVQVGHASVTVAEETRKRRPEWWKGWFDEGQCKVVVKVNSESELEDLKRGAEELGLVSAIIHDRGLTQVAPGTPTCVGIGPAPAELVDKITGELPLL
jgi:PTH2 family peptidyl-tRNA hydrolase